MARARLLIAALATLALACPPGVSAAGTTSGQQAGSFGLKGAGLSALKKHKRDTPAKTTSGSATTPTTGSSSNPAPGTSTVAPQTTTGASTPTTPAATTTTPAGGVSGLSGTIAERKALEAQRTAKLKGGPNGAHHGSGKLSGGALLLVILAGLLALGALVWAILRYAVIEPHWLLALRHSLSEAGYRASSVWSEFTDWARLGH